MPAQGGSTSNTKSSGSNSEPSFSSSLIERATTPTCCGANFFSAELIAAANASYSSSKTMFGCGPSVLVDFGRAGTRMSP